MNIKQAERELVRMRALNDGQEYCITVSKKGKISVGIKTNEQTQVESSRGAEINNMKLTDMFELARKEAFYKHKR